MNTAPLYEMMYLHCSFQDKTARHHMDADVNESHPHILVLICHQGLVTWVLAKICSLEKAPNIFVIGTQSYAHYSLAVTSSSYACFLIEKMGIMVSLLQGGSEGDSKVGNELSTGLKT